MNSHNILKEKNLSILNINHPGYSQTMVNVGSIGRLLYLIYVSVLCFNDIFICGGVQLSFLIYL